MTSKGYFITLEGGEASGKSTNLNLMSAWLQDAQIAHIVTHEPGGTPCAEKIRKLLLASLDQEPMHEDTELLLMFAARAQHLHQVIMPALASGQWVVCSRFTDSSYAYQGGGRGIDSNKIAQLEQFVHPSLQPDLTILLDLPVEAALQRMHKRHALDRIEGESCAFFERVRAAYLARAKQDPKRFRILDARLPLEAVQQEIIILLKALKAAKNSPRFRQ